MTDDEKRDYILAEIEQAGLSDEQGLLALSAAMSTGDFLCDDDFEQMVADCIQGAAESAEPARPSRLTLKEGPTMPQTLRTITVGELIELLQGEDEDQLVIFSTDYGDHHHTPQALPLRGELETVTVSKSAYSNSGFQVAEPDEDEADDDAMQYLLIS